jgi:AraC-like DNA-binding protein
MHPNFNNIYVLNEEQESLSLSDERIEQTMRDLHPRLMIFDPLQAYLGAQVDMHRANEVRPVLGRIGHLAEKYHCAVVFVMHNSKASQNTALHRALGSVDIPAVARSMLVLGKNPDNPDGRILCHEKSSLAAHGKSLLFEIAPHLGGVVFGGFSDLKADDILNLRPETRAKPSKKRDELCDKIMEMFGDGDTIEIGSIEELCEQLGCSRKTLYRAKRELEIMSESSGFGEEKKSVWRIMQ